MDFQRTKAPDEKYLGVHEGIELRSGRRAAAERSRGNRKDPMGTFSEKGLFRIVFPDILPDDPV